MKNSFSPRAAGRSSRGPDFTPQLPKLPKINDRKSVMPTKNESLNEAITDRAARSSVKAINFFDIPSPVDQHKVAIVRNLLERRRVTSPPNVVERELDKDQSASLVGCYQNNKSEIELQIEFLQERKMVSPKGKKETPEYSFKEHSAETVLIPGIERKIVSPMEEVKSPEKGLKDLRSIETETEKNTVLQVKKENFIWVLPSYSRQIIKLTPSVDLNTNVEDRSEIVFELREEVNRLQKLNLQLQSAIQSQNQHFDELSKKLRDDKKSLVVNLGAAKNQLALVQESLAQASEEIIRLKNEREGLKKQLSSTSLFNSDSGNSTNTHLDAMKEELEEKEKEYETIKEQLKNSENKRKKFIEVAKDLELELISQKNINEVSEKALSKLKAEFEILTVELKDEKIKTSVIEGLKNDLSNSIHENSLLKQENLALELAKSQKAKSLDSLQTDFETLRLEWREKENTLSITIKHLHDQIQNEKVKTSVQVAETAKLRRVLTLRDNDSVTNISKDEISRYQQKLLQLEKDHSEGLIEIEKLKKTNDYYKGLLRNKDEIIKKLESIEKEKTALGSHKDFLTDFQKLVTCASCQKLACTNILTPCLHLLCEDCQPASRYCPICESLFETLSLYSDCHKLKEVCLTLEPLFINKNSC